MHFFLFFLSIKFQGLPLSLCTFIKGVVSNDRLRASRLLSELERNMNETHHLMETRKNLEKALNETEGPMRVTSECIYHREGRKGESF